MSVSRDHLSGDGERLEEALREKLDAIERPSKGSPDKDDYERGVQWTVNHLRRWLATRLSPESGVGIDGAVELLAERLFRFNAIQTGSVTRWPDTAEGTRNGWRQDARAHLEAIRHLLTQPSPENSSGVEEGLVERLRERLTSTEVLRPLAEGLFGTEWSASHIEQLAATFNGVCNDLSAELADAADPDRCSMCGDLGWVLDCNDLDKAGPRMAELIPCIQPECEKSGQPVQSLCFKGLEFTAVSKHPRTGVVMSVSAALSQPDPTTRLSEDGLQAVLAKIRAAAFANRGSEVGTAYANAGEWLRIATTEASDD